MLGAVVGDIIGSVYEFAHPHIKTEVFPLFSPHSDYTDDSVLTVAVADAILGAGDYGRAIKAYARGYPGRGYGGNFAVWIRSEDNRPYNSFGNGSAMRVSPVGWAFDTEETVLQEAEKSAAVTHNHPEGIKGAQAVALAIWLARQKCTKAEIKQAISFRFAYDLSPTLAQIRPTYRFDETCPGSVPQSIVAFLEADSFESTIRKAISLGGDTDTMAAIAGSIAEAFYDGVPAEIVAAAGNILPAEFKSVINRFHVRYQLPGELLAV